MVYKTEKLGIKPIEKMNVLLHFGLVLDLQPLFKR